MAEVYTELPFNPITIVNQDHDTVTFTITNPFSAPVLAVYYQYATATIGDIKCFSEAPFVSCPEPIEVTAHCLTGARSSLAIVDVWFVDPSAINSSDSVTVPECCEPDDEQTSIPTVQYTFKVYCEPKCPDPTSSRRTLSEHSEPISKNASEFERVAQEDGIVLALQHEDNVTVEGHFCSAVDYPCGEKGNMVNVFHYSSRDGYQTYCVPESDTEVLAYVPKDYCGPCVGGYRSTSRRK